MPVRIEMRRALESRARHRRSARGPAPSARSHLEYAHGTPRCISPAPSTSSAWRDRPLDRADGEFEPGAAAIAERTNWLSGPTFSRTGFAAPPSLPGHDRERAYSSTAPPSSRPRCWTRRCTTSGSRSLMSSLRPTAPTRGSSDRRARRAEQGLPRIRRLGDPRIGARLRPTASGAHAHAPGPRRRGLGDPAYHPAATSIIPLCPARVIGHSACATATWSEREEAIRGCEALGDAHCKRTPRRHLPAPRRDRVRARQLRRVGCERRPGLRRGGSYRRATAAAPASRSRPSRRSPRAPAVGSHGHDVRRCSS